LPHSEAAQPPPAKPVLLDHGTSVHVFSSPLHREASIRSPQLSRRQAPALDHLDLNLCPRNECTPRHRSQDPPRRPSRHKPMALLLAAAVAIGLVLITLVYCIAGVKRFKAHKSGAILITGESTCVGDPSTFRGAQRVMDEPID
jgi:hypothetical protein